MQKIIIYLMTLLITNNAWGFSYTIEITENELQEKISSMMPLTKKKFFITTTLSEPRIDLLDENALAIKTNIEATLPGGFKGRGEATISGSLRYNAEKGEFYLDKPDIISLHIEQLDDKHQSTVLNITKAMATKALSIFPIYKLKDNNLKHKLAKATLESVEVKNETLFVTLSAF